MPITRISLFLKELREDRTSSSEDATTIDQKLLAMWIGMYTAYFLTGATV